MEAVLRRDRLVVLVSLFLLLLLAWLYLFRLSAEMTNGGGMDMPGMEGMADMPGMAGESAPATGVLADFALLSSMWSVMMVGMMLPSAAPTILLFSALERKRGAGEIVGRIAFFVAGYFLVWGLFSLAAAAGQTILGRLGLMTPQMAVTGAMLGGAVFILAGLYEFTPLKDRCLVHCRSPLDWIPRHLRPGRMGALRMGMQHGAYCVGCCWMLMLLLFVGGVMNLLWVAAIAAIVLVQKLLPGGLLATRIAGATLIACGIVLIARPLVAA
jgi:predicted metal-binding membrane protein